jgi:hypothetical protein
VVSGSSLAEPWDDSSAVEVLGFLTAGAWRLGRPLHAAASVLVEAMYAVVAPRRTRGNRGPETVRSPWERLPSHWLSRRAPRRHAWRIVVLFVPVESADQSIVGIEALKGPRRLLGRTPGRQQRV